MHLIASGEKQNADVMVAGLGKTKVIVYFDNGTYKITNIKFEGQRPDITQSIRNKLNKKKKNNDDEIRHIRSVEWKEEELRSKYLRKTAGNIMKNKSMISKFFSEKSTKELDPTDCIAVVKIIAEEYLKAVAQDSHNLFTGGRHYNNFSGKLCLLLKSYIQEGKEVFEVNLKKKPSFFIEIPKDCEFGNGKDFFASVREELNSDIIEIESWDMLLELYFSVNYDEPYKQNSYKEEENMKLNCEARADFLSAFERYGEYGWQPNLSNQSQSKIKTNKNSNSNDDYESEEEDKDKKVKNTVTVKKEKKNTVESKKNKNIIDIIEIDFYSEKDSRLIDMIFSSPKKSKKASSIKKSRNTIEEEIEFYSEEDSKNKSSSKEGEIKTHKPRRNTK